MTLNDQANFVCGKINQTDPTDVGACKGFLRRRNEMIWADQLWKDSLFEYTQTLVTPGYAPTSTWLPVNKVLLLPTQISHVVAVRTDTRKLNVEGSDHFYRIDFDSFQGSGSVTQYRNLPPAVWQWDTPQNAYLRATAQADAALSPRVRLLLADGVTLQDAAMTVATLVGSALRIDAVSKIASQGAVTLGINPTPVLLVNNSGLDLLFETDSFFYDLAPGAFFYVFPTTTISWAANPGAPIVVPGKLAFSGTISFDGANFTFAADAGPVLTLQPGDITAPKRCRIQLFGTVPESSLIRVLGKIVCPDFADDNDEPALTGVENCLLAFGQADMLQRERQYGKAQACAQEGQALLDQLKRVQVVQQAHNQRFIPEEGYGPDYQTYNSPLTF